MQFTLPLFSFKSNLFLTLIRFIKKSIPIFKRAQGRSKSALEVVWLVSDKEDSGGGQGGRGGKEPSRRQRVRMTIVYEVELKGREGPGGALLCLRGHGRRRHVGAPCSTTFASWRREREEEKSY